MLGLPEMSSRQVGALEPGTDRGRAGMAEQVEVGHAGCGHHAMMVRCAVTTGLPELTAHIVKLGGVRGLDVRYNHRSVVRWIRGETPRQRTAEMIAQILGDVLCRPATVADIGMAQCEKTDSDAALRLTLHPSETARLLAGLAHDDLENRRTLLEAGFDLAAFRLRPP